MGEIALTAVKIAIKAIPKALLALAILKPMIKHGMSMIRALMKEGKVLAGDLGVLLRSKG